MTLPASGAISLNDVNVELGLSATAQIGMNDAAVRDLFDVPSGAISMSDGYGKSAVYTIDRSLRFRSSASAYLNRTSKATANTSTYTYSAWVKRGTFSVGQALLWGGGSHGGGDYGTDFLINSSGQLFMATSNGAGDYVSWASTGVLRDPSGWYHVVMRQSGSTTTWWVNNVQYFNGTTRSQLFFNWSSAIPQEIGRVGIGGTSYLDGYMTEVNFIDGQALDPTYFGEYNGDSGAWQPIEYSGSYGTNGFYLNFSNNANTTTLGYDYSGNGSNWTTNNISLTSGYTYDSMTDTPTPYLGGGNYCTLNPNDVHARPTIVDGNLGITSATASKYGVGTIAVNSGKWYYEAQYTTTPSTNGGIGVATALDWPNMGDMDSASSGIRYNPINGRIYIQGVLQGTFATYTSGDIIGVAFDCDNGAISFYKNNALQTTLTGITALQNNSIAPVLYNYVGNMACNFGQRPFAYTPPTGFKALHTGNLPDSTVVDGSTAFDVLTYTGTGTTQSITGLEFQPDLVWIKSRSNSYNHELYDSVRGVQKRLLSNLNNAESTSTNGLTSFNSNGFTQGGETETGANGATYVAWNWKANGAGVSNTNGSITSTVSANPTAGFSIVTYTGTGSAATVGHGLGVAPRFIIAKRRNAAVNWFVGSGALPSWSYALEGLNTTAAANSGATAVWNSTAPTSSVFSVGIDLSASGGTYVAYCFSEVDGYSKFGSYTGNGSATDGTFVFTGFRPAFVMVKRTDSGNNWFILDTARNTANLTNNQLYPNSQVAEGTNGDCNIDILSNGFKLRTALDASNGSGGTYIYMAFAEHPFKYSLAR